MERRPWQLALCGLIFAACFNPALAQKADFAAAARHAGELVKLDRTNAVMTPTELEQRKARVITKVPPAERPAFVSEAPSGAGEALYYYYIVNDCIGLGWPQNCATRVSKPTGFLDLEREFGPIVVEEPLAGQSFPASAKAAGDPQEVTRVGVHGEEMQMVGSGYPGAQSAEAWTQEFKQRSFEWHLLTTRIIFGMVVFIVGFGLYITYLQFKRDYTDSSYQQTTPQRVEIKPADGEAAAVVVPTRSVTTMKLGPGGLELSSQIIGLAVLAFSLGFFYLYVKEIYPMTEVAVEKALAKSKSGGATK